MTNTDTNQPIARPTPGPWFFNSRECGKPIYNSGRFAIAYMDAYEPDEDDGGAWEQETEANGNLVAAAPDMHHALMLWVSGADFDEFDQAARIALAKATARNLDKEAA